MLGENRGKNDGTVQGVQYFTCRPKCGIFVRADKLIQDRRGRAMRGSSSATLSGTIRRSTSRGDGLHTLHRSRSRGESLPSVGTRCELLGLQFSALLVNNMASKGKAMFQDTEILPILSGSSSESDSQSSDSIFVNNENEQKLSSSESEKSEQVEAAADIDNASVNTSDSDWDERNLEDRLINLNIFMQKYQVQRYAIPIPTPFKSRQERSCHHDPSKKEKIECHSPFGDRRVLSATLAVGWTTDDGELKVQIL
ncbi:unnamed protein product, partial [Timema podura]|nr:unnamed protein product [Timema podura]